MVLCVWFYEMLVVLHAELGKEIKNAEKGSLEVSLGVMMYEHRVEVPFAVILSFNIIASDA
jgi:hypothetical protein